MSKTELYPVIIPDFCGGRPVLEILEAVLKGGAKIVQLRDKKQPEKYAADFRRLTTYFRAQFIINDSIEVALRANADGVHIGQEDIGLIIARRFAPHHKIGVSVNNLEEARLAQKHGATYITLGVAFPTRTKPDVKHVTGLHFIRQAAPKLDIPTAAIGGINFSNIDQVVATGVKYIAIASAITQAPNVEQATRDFIARCARI